MSISTRRMTRGSSNTTVGVPVQPTGITFTPTLISVGTLPDVTNSGRGEYFWLEQSADPLTWPLVDSYYRDEIPWRVIEPSRGTYSGGKWNGIYDFTLIENYLALASQSGGRLGFRIMPYFDNNTWYNGTSGQTYQPPWVHSIAPASGSVPAPDWSSTGYYPSDNTYGYLDVWSALIAAIGSRFNNDPRLFYMDTSGYGAWGEWTLDDIFTDPVAPGTNDLTDPTMQAICNAAINAFNADNSDSSRTADPTKGEKSTFVLAPAGNFNAFEYAQATNSGNNRVGVRYDFLGGQSLTFQGLGEPWASHWKKAPIVTEWDSVPASFSVSQGLDNVQQMHASMLSSGNKPTLYASMSSGDQASFVQANEISGFRYSLTRIIMSTNITAGTTMSVTTTWKNDGVAPTYDSWTVQLILIAANGARWAMNLNDDLTKVYYSGTGAVSYTTTVTLPSSLTVGTFSAAIQVTDLSTYLAPMNLAMSGRDSKGAYVVGNVVVASGSGSARDITPPATPIITSASSMTSSNHTVGNITGTAEANASVRVVVNNRPHLTTASSGGAWSISPKNYFTAGHTYPISVTATDAAGNTSTAATQTLSVS